MFIYTPETSGEERICSHPVSLIDIYPTLIELCSLPEDPNEGHINLPLNGHSLSQFLHNQKTKKWEGPATAFMGVKDQDQSPQLSVVSDRYRYTLCSNGEEELYNHRKDPNEWVNLAKDPKYFKIKNQLRQEMEKIFRR